MLITICNAELNTGVMLLRNTDWTRQFIDDVARLGKMHVNHWQLMDQVSLSQTGSLLGILHASSLALWFCFDAALNTDSILCSQLVYCWQNTFCVTLLSCWWFMVHTVMCMESILVLLK